jgi:hypothetical protein
MTEFARIHQLASARVESMFRLAMGADQDAQRRLAAGLDPATARFLGHSRMIGLAGAAALTGTLESHRLVAGDVCLSCGTVVSSLCTAPQFCVRFSQAAGSVKECA